MKNILEYKITDIHLAIIMIFIGSWVIGGFGVSLISTAIVIFLLKMFKIIMEIDS